MSNNCLVTKLKGVVDNDNLHEYGSFRVHYNSAYATSNVNTKRAIFNLSPGTVSCKVHTVGGGTFSILNNTQSAKLVEHATSFIVPYNTGNNDGWFTVEPDSEGEFDIFIGCKYNCLQAGTPISFGINLDQFNYVSDFVGVITGSSSWKNLTGVLSPKSSVFHIDLSCQNNASGTYSGASVDVEALKKCSNLKFLRIKGYLDVSFNINDVLNNKLSLLYLSAAFAPSITGDIKVLADAQVAAGRTIGSLQIEPKGSSTTFDGIPIMNYIQEHGGFWYININFDPSATGGYTVSFSNE